MSMVGNTKTITFTCRDSDSDLTAASTTTVTFRKPDGTEVTPTVTNTSTGVYEASVTPADGEHGDWLWRVQATDSAGNELSVQGTFAVEQETF